MALPPTVPTSFVPKQPVQTTRRASRSGTNLFTFASLALVAIALVGSALTFGYQKFLESSRDRKAEELAAAEATISRASIEEFIRLRNRLSAADGILDQHTALTQYLDVLETSTLESVSFDSLALSIEADRTAKLEMKGSARSFNALAVQSATFAAEKRIKRAIFSDISTTDAGLVGFSLTAELSPDLVIWNGVVAPPAEAATTTPSL